MNKSYKNLVKFISILLILIGVYYVGYGVGHKNLILENRALKLVGVNEGKPKEVDFSTFWDAWNIVKNKFIKKDLDEQKMLYGSISGMMNSLGDPYSIFMTPDESKMLNEDLNGSFGGIGIEVTAKDGFLVVVSPLDDTPAKNAGILAKDIIIKIDGKDVGDFTYIEAINNIRGPKGSEVVLTIVREGESEEIEVAVMRDTIVVESVKHEILDDDIMFVRISQFGSDTNDIVKQIIDEVQVNNIKKMIVDVRNNPGGYLMDCIDITSLFISEGVVVKEVNRNGEITESKTTTMPRLDGVKVVVLINAGSASASEIFAGAIQDTKRGIVIGEKSFGKGSVQTIEKLVDGSQLKYTIAKWLTPLGNEIDKKGIVPDIEVEMTSEDYKNENDTQLQRAKEELSK